MRAIASRKEWKPKSEMSEQMANYIMVRAEEYLGLLEARISEFAGWFDGLGTINKDDETDGCI